VSFPPQLLSQMIDLQESSPKIRLKLTRVGVKNLTVELKVRGKDGILSLLPTVELYVDLPSSKRGVHLSRDPEAIYEVLEQRSGEVYLLEDFCETLARDLLARHDYASRAEVSLQSTYMLSRRAPGQQVVTREPCDILGMATATRDGGGHVAVNRAIGVRVVGFTACPCTQALLKILARDRLMTRGYAEDVVEAILDAVPCATHTQRSTGFVLLRVPEGYYVNVEDLAALVEASMSGQTYAILKRPAEATVVERGTVRAMFSEDVVREVLLALSQTYRDLPDSVDVVVQVFSNESVHKHDIFAERTTTLGEIRMEMDAAGED
jgi:GTP cyclohydrolase-4